MSPITIPVTPRPHYPRAHWDAFRCQVDNKINEINSNQLTKDETDKHPEAWFKTVPQAMNTHTHPCMNTNKTTFKAITNPTIKHSMDTQTVLNEATETGWSLKKHHIYIKGDKIHLWSSPRKLYLFNLKNKINNVDQSNSNHK